MMQRRSDSSSGVGAGIALFLALAGMAGWVMNIVKLIGMADSDVSTEFIIRIIGVPVAVLGAIMGYL